MEAGLRALEAKYPGHVFTLEEEKLFCDGQYVVTVKKEFPPERPLGNGMTEQELFDRVVEFHVRLIEDPHYYDYDVAQKRRRNAQEPHQVSDSKI
jgi:hypothetical protein